MAQLEWFAGWSLQTHAGWILLLAIAGVALLALVVTVLLLLGRVKALNSGLEAIGQRQQGQARDLDRVRNDIINQSARQHANAQESALRGLQLVERRSLEDSARLRNELVQRFEQLKAGTNEALSQGRLSQQQSLTDLRQALETRMHEALDRQQTSLRDGMGAVSKLVSEALRGTREEVGKRVDALTKTTDDRLKEISGQVEKRLRQGFEKTTETFTRVLEHLSRIDEAQKKITELSSSVVSLQEVLTDKRSRGAFGEVQLSGLVGNLMPEHSYALQHTLSNGTRVDCMLFLPRPTGNVPIDAKFPLESFQRMMDPDLPESERTQAARQFKLDIRKHIDDIAGKYLIPEETSDGALMFLPAEAVFAEIHAHFPELVQHAQERRVWLSSPTTLMAILTTARAVLKDEATRRQVHVIRDHLRALAKDFDRFQSRMDNLGKHIKQANKDVDDIGISARKISGRFDKIEQVQLDPLQEEALPPPALEQDQS